MISTKDGLLKEEQNIKKSIYEKWQKHNIFSNVDEHIREDTALMMETVRLESDKEHDALQFIKIAAAATLIAFPKLLAHDLVSVQPLLAKEWFYRYISRNAEKIKPIDAKIKNLKSLQSYKSANILAESLKHEIDREVISDLYYNASFESEWNFTGDYQHLMEEYREMWNYVCDTAKQIGENIGRSKANWLVSSPEICQALQVGAGVEPRDPTKGKLEIDGIVLYSDSVMPIGKAVIGYRGLNQFDAGYVYCPYRFIHIGEGVDNAFFPQKPLAITRAKTFIPNVGQDYYAIFKVKNWI